MRFHVLAGIVAMVLVSGCFGNAPQYSPPSSVTYVCPDGWSITEEMEYGGVGYYSACEDGNENSTGLFVMSWFSFEQDLNDSLEQMKSNLEEGYSSEGVVVHFTEETAAWFGGYPALTAGYGFLMDGIDYQGRIIAFNCDGKSVVLLSQEGVEDHDGYLADFEAIGNSVDCMAPLLEGE